MNDEHDPAATDPADTLPSVEQISRLDADLDRLVANQRPAAHELTPDEQRERVLAAQLRLARDGVEEPTPAFLQSLELAIGSAVAKEQRSQHRHGLSRGRFLRSLATIVGGASLGVAGVEGAIALQEQPRPQTLLMAGNERWYDVAAADDVKPGGGMRFSAGGLVGYLLNDGGDLHAVSAICTHMGCLLKLAGNAQGLHCLCHSSTFSRDGKVSGGLAPTALPTIAVRVENGRVLALGTRETV